GGKDMRVVDLTLPINRRMRPMPKVAQYTENPTRCVALTALSDGHLARLRAEGIETAANVEVAHHMTSRLEILTHIGTHIDAPAHFLEDGWTIDKVPLDRIVKRGRIIPLKHVAAGAAVTADDILATGVDFDDSVIPILQTGWTDRAWDTDAFWQDTIYMDLSVSRLLVERGVSAVAIDFFPEIPFWRMPRDPTLPPGPNHRALLANKCIIIQMVANVDAIGADDFTLCAVPLALEGLDGSPARVFAMVP
ncbi:MAG: cyclase family protein, partial [Rhodospirillaceae bacterium]